MYLVLDGLSSRLAEVYITSFTSVIMAGSILDEDYKDRRYIRRIIVSEMTVFTYSISIQIASEPLLAADRGNECPE